MGAFPSKAQILQSIKDFLDAEASHPKLRQCRYCGSAMEFVQANFLLGGTGMNWNVSLPVCPVCDGATLRDLPRAETIH